MSTQIGQTSQFTDLTPHLQLSLETCPTCGQEIPHEKIEEIGGRIAAKEHEQTVAITAQLEKQYAVERLAAEAKAKADLESERQQSAVREMHARTEAQKAAEELFQAKLAEADQARTELVSEWEHRLAEAESARKSAKQTEATLQEEMKALQQKNAEAKEREAQIENEAKRTAESLAEQRIAGIEAAHRESEAGLHARVKDAEASRIAAEQKESALAKELDELRQAKETEVARVKEEAATQLSIARQAAREEVEERFRVSLAAHENAVAEANAKASQAEAKVLELTDQHTSALEASLNTQREILEKAKEDAVNTEKARAFEENQKLSTKVMDLQRALDNKTAEELGEGAEVNVFEALKAEFKDDRIERIPKGAPGADIRHVVKFRGQECGTILYDSKNHNQWRNEHVTKLRKDQLAEKAEHAILSTHKFPQGTRQIHNQDGVLLANPARVVSLATIIRQHLIQVHTLRMSKVEREKKTAVLYEFITSERCTQLLARIDERAANLLEQQEKEMRWHQNHWRKEGEAIRAIQKAKADLANEIDSIIGTCVDDAEDSEAS
jgi:hypothetical protein